MSKVICHSCGSIDDYRTVHSGPHIKAICNGCDKYIKFLSKTEIMERPPHCPKCGEIGTLKTENYGMFHVITKCSNCSESVIKDKPKTLPDEKPAQNNMYQNQQNTYPQPAPQPQAQQPPQPAQQQKTLAPVRLFPAHPNAPDFVLASAVIGLDEFWGFIQQNPQLLTDYQGKKQLKIQILRSKEGKLYSVVDDFRPASAPQPAAPAQWGGYTTSPVGPTPPAQQPATWGAPPAQQQAATWGGQPAATEPAYSNELPF